MSSLVFVNFIKNQSLNIHNRYRIVRFGKIWLFYFCINRGGGPGNGETSDGSADNEQIEMVEQENEEQQEENVEDEHAPGGGAGIRGGAGRPDEEGGANEVIQPLLHGGEVVAESGV